LKKKAANDSQEQNNIIEALNKDMLELNNKNTAKIKE